MKLTVSTFLTLVALLLGGCRDWFPPVDPIDPNDPKDPRDTIPQYDTTDTKIIDKKWCLVGIEALGMFETSDILLDRHIIFDAQGNITGSGGYNMFNGDYKVSNGAMSITNFVSTKRLSDNMEQKFFEILVNAARYETDGYNLVIMNDNGETLHLTWCDGPVVIDDPKSVALNEEFRLHVGLSAIVIGEDLQVDFRGVGDDSRCPLGVHCVWEGDASLLMQITSGGNTISTKLHTNQSVGPREVSFNGYTITLVELQPMPLPNVQINPDEYVAVLRVTK